MQFIYGKQNKDDVDIYDLDIYDVDVYVLDVYDMDVYYSYFIINNEDKYNN